jgi:RecB family exonuclease
MLYMQYSAYTTAHDDYVNYQALYASETNTALIADYKAQKQTSHEDMMNANDAMKAMAGVAGAVWIANAVHAYIVGPKTSQTALHETPVRLAYDPHTDQVQFSFSIPLD